MLAPVKIQEILRLKLETLAILAGTEQLYWMKWPTWSDPRLLELQPKMDWYLHIHFVDRGVHLKYTWPLRGMVGHRQSLKVCVTSLVDSSSAKPRVNLLNLVWKWYTTSWKFEILGTWYCLRCINLYQEKPFTCKTTSQQNELFLVSTNYSMWNDTCVLFLILQQTQTQVLLLTINSIVVRLGAFKPLADLPTLPTPGIAIWTWLEM